MALERRHSAETDVTAADHTLSSLLKLHPYQKRFCVKRVKDFRIVNCFTSGAEKLMEEWEFYQNINGRWWWRNVTLNRTSESPDRFDSFIHVMGDAVRHGFEPGVSKVIAIQADRRLNPR